MIRTNPPAVFINRRTMKRIAYLLLILACLLPLAGHAQKIKGRYTSRAQEDGTLYHLYPVELFSNRENGNLTFDITYKALKSPAAEPRATINFTYYADRTLPADSIRFSCGDIAMQGRTEKIYVEPDKKRWKHRYTVSVPAATLYRYFDETRTPAVTLYTRQGAVEFPVRRSEWKDYAPVAFRIFEMIRYNEQE